jgi:hypothetical protein
MGMKGKIFTNGALVDPAVGKDKKIVSHVSCAFKFIFRVEKHLGIGDGNALAGYFLGRLRNSVQPGLSGYLEGMIRL